VRKRLYVRKIKIINKLPTEKFNAVVWNADIDAMPGPKRWGITAVRVAQVLLRDLADGAITLRAMGLVYTSLLSLVPLLALSFSMLKAFGMDNMLQPMLERMLAPLGERGEPLISAITEFVANVNVGILGVVGLVVLLYSVISMIQKIESGCNAIWEVRQPRSVGRRFTEYLSVLIVGPLVVVAATSMTASLSSTAVVSYLGTMEPFGTTLYVAGLLTPYVLYSAAFTFLYTFMPNTHVRLLPALGGGVFAGVLWQTASKLFTMFAANAGNVNAIYSGFAIVILLLIWLYVSWLIMFTGCRVAFLLQHRDQLTRGHYPPPLGNRRREELALLICLLIGRRFLHGEEPWAIEHLARTIRAVPAHVNEVVEQLVQGRILIKTGHDGITLMPRQDIGRLKINAIIAAVRAGTPHSQPATGNEPEQRQVAKLMQQAETARSDAFGQLSLRELVSASQEQTAHDD